MYKVIKAKGYNDDVSVYNTDTSSVLNLGRVKIPILEILKEGGYYTEDSDDLKIQDEWDLEVNKETAEKLAKLAMPMKKPIRNQSKKAKDLFAKPNKEIDAMDVLLGLAKYN